MRKKVRWQQTRKSASPQLWVNKFVLALGFLGLTHCATAPKQISSDVQLASWSGHARIEDKTKNSTHSVSLEFIAEKNKNLRLDVSAGPGIYVASLVMRDSEVQYLLARERKFYSGPASNVALAPVLGVSLHPMLLQTLLFETEPDSQWSCTRDGDRLLQKCVSADRQMTVAWANRSGSGKTIQITSPKVAIALRLGTPQENVKVTERTFQLSAPSGYKQYGL